MVISIDLVKELREATGVGILDCKKALQEANGDMDKAIEILRKQGLAAAKKQSGQETREGLVEAYIHTGNRIGALVELDCETDFVARTPDFGQLAHDLAMQVVGYGPKYISREDVPPDVVEQERAIYRAQAEREGKPPHVIERIIEGRLNKFYEEVCLLEQPFIRNDDMKVKDVIAQKIASAGENIAIKRFARFEIGEE
ncbi:MAG: translation elongation factor Ts [Chloroflexota bacterium]|nr:translation elongation factor Ts [Chloroflexota bacterium]